MTNIYAIAFIAIIHAGAQAVMLHGAHMMHEAVKAAAAQEIWR